MRYGNQDNLISGHQLISNSKIAIAIANVKLYFDGFYSAQTIVYYAILAPQQR